VRTLLYAHNCSRARHDIMELQTPHRDKRNAYYHYRKAIHFYDRIGITKVELMAAGFGPVRWPQFGFDIKRRFHKERLRRILKDANYTPLPADPMDLFAPDVAFTRRKRDLIGLKALEELGQVAEPISMYLDLNDQRQRRVLDERGIL